MAVNYVGVVAQGTGLSDGDSVTFTTEVPPSSPTTRNILISQILFVASGSGSSTIYPTVSGALKAGCYFDFPSLFDFSPSSHVLGGGGLGSSSISSTNYFLNVQQRFTDC